MDLSLQFFPRGTPAPQLSSKTAKEVEQPEPGCYSRALTFKCPLGSTPA